MSAAGAWMRLTPAGTGGLHVVQLSGPEVADFLRTAIPGLGRLPRAPRAARLRDDDGLVDEVLVHVLDTPAGVVAEIGIHGGDAVDARLAALLAARGFARRDDGLDLALEAPSRACGPAVLERRALREARGRRALEHALGGPAAALGRELEGIARDLESARDVVPVLERLESLDARARAACAFSRPPRVVLAGRVNAGKSALVNALAGARRALVTDEEGTTRDLVEVEIELLDLPFTLVDAAGERRTDDPVEREGLRRAQAAARAADLVLHLTDAEELVAGGSPAPVARGRLAIASRCDRVAPADLAAVLARRADLTAVSSTSGAGLDLLRARIVRHTAFGGPAHEIQPAPFSPELARAVARALALARAGRAADARGVLADLLRAAAIGENGAS